MSVLSRVMTRLGLARPQRPVRPLDPGPDQGASAPPPTDPPPLRLVRAPRSLDDLDLALADTAPWEPPREFRRPAGTLPPSFDDETTVRLLPPPVPRDASFIPTNDEVDDMLTCLEVGDLRGLYTRAGSDSGQD